jgi:hypothetical protein
LPKSPEGARFRCFAASRREVEVGGTGGLIDRLGIIGELFRFLWARRLWWLLPMMIVLVAIVALLVFAQGSAVAPFIYTLF